LAGGGLYKKGRSVKGLIEESKEQSRQETTKAFHQTYPSYPLMDSVKPKQIPAGWNITCQTAIKKMGMQDPHASNNESQCD